MDDAKGWMVTVAKGLALSIAYCIVYLVLRYYSFDQWALPTGLRAVCLFLMPLRYWPFIFIGDAAAVMYGRLSIADENSLIWVYLGPFALIVGVSIAPYFLRKKLPNLQAITRHFPIAAACFAVWGSVCTVGLNVLLGGPSENATITFFATKFLGNYMGTLMGMLPVLAWINRRQFVGTPKKAIRDISLAIVSIVALFAYLKYWHGGDSVGRVSVLMLMLSPALFLTYHHGWLGAAVGVFLVNLGIAQTMHYVRAPGAAPYDETVFLAQIGLALTASVFLILGTRITSHYNMAVDAGVAEEEAREISRLALLSNEDDSRDQAIYMAQLHVLTDGEMRELVPWLKAQGKFTEALALNRQAAQHRALFDQYAIAFYPVGIEKHGLFAVVQSQAFEDRWAGGIPIAIRFDNGTPKILSTKLQLVAFRCLCSAVVLMRDWKPEELHFRLRAWQTARGRGLYFSISAFNPGEAEASQVGAAASLLLNARVNAYGGIVRRHTHRISVLLSEGNA